MNDGYSAMDSVAVLMLSASLVDVEETKPPTWQSGKTSLVQGHGDRYSVVPHVIDVFTFHVQGFVETSGRDCTS
jgi:hypothetical protein